MAQEEVNDNVEMALAPPTLRLESFLVCPITQELFVDPVLAEDGHTYERMAITRWFSTGNTRSPVTNEALSDKKRLEPNRLIRKIVHFHRHQLGVKLIEACENGNDAEIHDLLERGADLNARSASGDTPLLLLIAQTKLDLARKVVQMGADASLTNDKGESPEAAARRRRLAQDFISFLQEATNVSLQKRAIDQENRQKERDEYRRIQEQRRAEGAEANSIPGLVPGVGFFPSLFGLQFQGALVNNVDGSRNNYHVDNSGIHPGAVAVHPSNAPAILTNGLTHWARINIAGDPELAVGHEDHIQQQILSRALLTVGSLVLLCLLLL